MARASCSPRNPKPMMPSRINSWRIPIFGFPDAGDTGTSMDTLLLVDKTVVAPATGRMPNFLINSLLLTGFTDFFFFSDTVFFIQCMFSPLLTGAWKSKAFKDRNSFLPSQWAGLE
jgi:hypothetical protein